MVYFDSQLVGQVCSLIWTITYAVLNICLHVPYYIVWNAIDAINGRRGLRTKATHWQGATMYNAKVYHSRSKPSKHAFEYNVRVSVIDLDSPPWWWGQSGASRNDTMTGPEARALAGTQGKVRLLTNPPVAGYRQNPISVYYCYNLDEELAICIAEVTNTPWADRVTFLFRPDGESVPKSLHVSPLMDMKSTWTLKTNAPGDSFFLSVSVCHPSMGEYFTAWMKGSIDQVNPHQPNEMAGILTLFKYGFQPQRIAAWIYWHALVLLWKGVPFYGPPPLEVCQAAARKSGNPKMTDGCAFKWRPATSWPWRSQP